MIAMAALIILAILAVSVAVPVVTWLIVKAVMLRSRRADRGR